MLGVLCSLLTGCVWCESMFLPFFEWLYSICDGNLWSSVCMPSWCPVWGPACVCVRVPVCVCVCVCVSQKMWRRTSKESAIFLSAERFTRFYNNSKGRRLGVAMIARAGPKASSSSSVSVTENWFFQYKIIFKTDRQFIRALQYKGQTVSVHRVITMVRRFGSGHIVHVILSLSLKYTHTGHLLYPWRYSCG